jgi:hypothetical protein
VHPQIRPGDHDAVRADPGGLLPEITGPQAMVAPITHKSSGAARRSADAQEPAEPAGVVGLKERLGLL